jgi:hypothetical protein
MMGEREPQTPLWSYRVDLENECGAIIRCAE